MPGVVRRMVRQAILFVVLCCAVWYGMRGYFTYVYPIAHVVRQQVQARYQPDHGKYITYKEIPTMYRMAVIAAEDQSFFRNIGVDVFGLGRALIVDLTQRKAAQGGSTITQQLVHNTVLKNQSKTLTWKLREIVDAIGLYDTMNKQEVFELYANDIYFGHGAYGLYSAAMTYFGRVPDALNNGELIMLAGIPNAPSSYDPFKNFNLARQRQQLVLESMIENGIINQRTANRIFEEPIRLKH